MKKYLPAFILALLLPFAAFAVQVTVPSASSVGQTLAGLSTGNYQATSSLVVVSNGNVGVGTTSPFAQISIAGAAGGTTSLFAISTSTSGFATTTALRVSQNGNIHMSNGAGIDLGNAATPPANGIISLGNIGIGSTTPSTALSIGAGKAISLGNGGAAYATIQWPDATNGGNFSTSEVLINNNASSQNTLALRNSNCNAFSALTLRGDDNVEHLALGHVNSCGGYTGAGSDYLEISNYPNPGGTTAPPNFFIVRTGYINGAYTVANKSFQIDGSSGNVAVGQTLFPASLSVTNQYGAANSYLLQMASTTGGGTNTVFTVDATGATGINGANPGGTGAKLGVNGISLFGNGNRTQSDGNDVIYMEKTGYVQFHMYQPDSAVDGYFSMNKAGDNSGVGDTTAGAQLWTKSNNRLTFGTNSTGRMTLLGSGNTGFASTSPWARLSVDTSSLGTSPAFVVGSSTATSLVVSNAGNTGIGTTTPTAKLAVHANSGETNTRLFVVASSTVSTTTTLFSVGNQGEIRTGGGTPIVSTCGTGSPTAAGNDTAGTVTVGGGVVTACTVTYSTPKVGTPVPMVVVDGATAIAATISASSATAFTVTFAATVGGGTFNYFVPSY